MNLRLFLFITLKLTTHSSLEKENTINIQKYFFKKKDKKSKVPRLKAM